MPALAHLAPRLAFFRRRRLCIISPHLDDAAFSAFLALQAQGFEHRCVVSVVTVPSTTGGTQWARSAGFADPEAEFQARREEDLRALGSLGVDVQHLGVNTGGTPDSIDAALKAFLGAEVQIIDQTLYLLPGGAGRAELPRGPWHVLHRILRRPTGAVAHPEHLAVRNALTRRLGVIAGACFGFYGEQPYVWNDSTTRLREELEGLSGLQLEAFSAKPEIEAKLHLAKQYGSQFPLIFGQSAAFQRRALGRDEEYYLVR